MLTISYKQGLAVKDLGYVIKEGDRVYTESQDIKVFPFISDYDISEKEVSSLAPALSFEDFVDWVRESYGVYAFITARYLEDQNRWSQMAVCKTKNNLTFGAPDNIKDCTPDNLKVFLVDSALRMARLIKEYGDVSPLERIRTGRKRSSVDVIAEITGEKEPV